MNLLHWLDALSSAASPEPAPRRAAISQLGRAALATVPVLTLATTAVAGPPRTESFVTDGLNVVLRVALAQQALFTQGLLTPNGANFPTPDVRTQFETLKALADDSVARLRTSIERSGDIAVAPANYDFTGGRSSAHSGPLQPFTPSGYADFLGLAQCITDLLSRTIITVIGPMQGGGTFVELIAQLLATNSRMAALIRRQRGTTTWVTQADLAGAPTLLTTYYADEANTTQFALDLTSTGTTGVLPAPVPATSVLTEAFDEPLKLDAGETYPVKAVQARLDLLTY